VVWTTDTARHGVRPLTSAKEVRAVSDSNIERKRELECLRLASDLRQLSREPLNPNFKAHCLRMSAVWTEQVVLGLTNDPAPPNYLRH
jgi:hypothetical protein